MRKSKKQSITDLAKAHELHKAGRLEDAKNAYLAILAQHPPSAEVLHALAIVYTRQQQFSEAIDHLKSAVELEPTNPTLQLHLANVLKLQGLFNQAETTLLHLIETIPNCIPAYNNLGTVLYSKGQLDKAIEYYQQAIHKRPDYIDAYYNLGLALYKQNKISDAIQTYQTLLTKAKDHIAARFQLSCWLLEQDQLTESIENFLFVEKIQPHHFETQTNLATAYLKAGNLPEAKSHYIKALELRPDDIQILFNLGVILMQLGEVDQAIQYYQRADKLNHDDFSIHNNLGIAFLAKQHVGFALHHFQEALRLQPQNTAIQYTIEALSKNQLLLAAPPDYITTLFDAYADHYEPHLLQALDYQVPALLLEIFKSTRPSSLFDIADLGCGTGLCGVAFKPLAKTMVGVDLSEKMLNIAKQKNIYNDLVRNDLTVFLSDKHQAYDLLLAGDTLVYMGDLEAIFKAANAALRPQGYFLFNTEISDTANYTMNQSGRFAHQQSYLEKLAAQHHFEIVLYKNVITRLQNNEPVYGHLYMLRKV